MFAWLGINIFIALFIISDISELPLEWIIGAIYITPLIIAVSFTTDLIIFNRKWVIINKFKVLAVYALIVFYIILIFIH